MIEHVYEQCTRSTISVDLYAMITISYIAYKSSILFNNYIVLYCNAVSVFLFLKPPPVSSPSPDTYKYTDNQTVMTLYQPWIIYKPKSV